MNLLLRAITFLAIPVLTFADDLTSTEITFTRSPVTDNLSQLTVIQTHQDSVGALWFITQEGINRYTGKVVEQFRSIPEDKSSLSSNNVSRVAEDNNGNLWFASLGGGLNRFNSIENNFTRFQSDPNDSNSPISNNIITIFADDGGFLWLGYKNGYSRLNPTTGEFKHVIAGVQGAPYIDEVSDFAQGPNDTIWAATNSSGLLRIDRQSLTPSKQPVTLHNNVANHTPLVSRVLVSNSGTLWLSTRESGLLRYQEDKGTWDHFVHDNSDRTTLSSNKVVSIYEDPQGRLWVSTQEGLNEFLERDDSFLRYTPAKSGLPDGPIFSMYQSWEGRYWVGALLGLAVGAENQFALFDESTGGLSAGSVNAFAETSDGSLWVGTDSGLNRLRPASSEFEWINEYTEPGISSRTVMSLLADDNAIWVGTFDSGLNKIDLESQRTTIFRHDPNNENSIGANGITSIYRATDRSLLVGTYGGGLSILSEEGQAFTTYRYRPGDQSSLSDNRVLAIIEDSLGMIWIGTENGLNRFDPEKRKFTRIDSGGSGSNSLPASLVWSFHEDADRNLWIGTSGGGVVKWSAQARAQKELVFVRPDPALAIPSSNIYGILSDKASNIWISHNRGLTKLTKDLTRATNYSARDGLQPSEFNLGAAYAAENGDLYFGGARGFNKVDTDVIEASKFRPPIAISKIMVMNERQEFDVPYNKLERIRLGHEDVMFAVEFFAADYSAPDLVKYAYKLEGINPDWIISDDSRIASFTTLPPGNYELKLAASSPAGIWNWDALSIPISVSPPPWRSPYAYAVYVLTAVLLLMYQFKRQRRQAAMAAERQRELEQKVDERTVDLQEARYAAEAANRAKSDFLATMSHEIRTPMHGMVGMTELLLHTSLTDQQKRFAEAAHNSGKSLIQLINDILDFSKLEASKVELEEVAFSVAELVDEVCYLQSEPAFRKHLNLYNVCDPDDKYMLIGDPTKIRQVVMNLVSNSIKFTQNGYIKVATSICKHETDSNKSVIRIDVCDTGIGIENSIKEKIFDAFTQADASTTRKFGGTGLGLSISRQFVEMMGGLIDVDSTPGEGTTISISIPVKRTNEKSFSVRYDLKALVVSESAEMLQMIGSHCSLLGMDITVSRNVPDILDTLSRFDLVITDTQGAPNLESKVTGRTDRSGPLGVLVAPLTIDQLDSVNQSIWQRVSFPISRTGLAEAIDTLQFKEATNDISDNPTTKKIGGARILVAEDVDLNQKIVLEMLSILGCDAAVANNGRVALEMFESGTYDLILMDCQMPELDGYETTKRIREIERERGTSQLPIVALTAGVGSQDRARCLAAGMNDYLPKPFSISDLSDALFNNITDQRIDYENRPRETSSRELTPLPNDMLSESFEVLNKSSLSSIREVEKQTGNALLPRLVEGYSSQVYSKLSELEDSLSDNNADEVYKTAHAIKSMSANLGAEKVMHICARIEKNARAGSLDSADNLAILIEPAIREFLKEINNELNRNTVNS